MPRLWEDMCGMWKEQPLPEGLQEPQQRSKRKNAKERESQNIDTSQKICHDKNNIFQYPECQIGIIMKLTMTKLGSKTSPKQHN